MRREVAGPDTVMVQSGTLRLHGLVWRPKGTGRFAGVLFDHGSAHGSGRDEKGVPEERHPEILGPIFARHGYVFLYLFRRGTGLSSGVGQASGDFMDAALARHGPDERNRAEIWLLDNLDLRDALNGLKVLRGLPDVDKRRVAVAGEGFGGSLTLILAERDPSLRAAVAFSCAGPSWQRSPLLRARLISAVSQTRVPILFLQAANDSTLAPGKALAAEMARLGKPHELRIEPRLYPASSEGRSAASAGIRLWETDVFRFLDRWTAPR